MNYRCPIVFIHGLGPSHKAYEMDCHEEYARANGVEFIILKIPRGELLTKKAEAAMEQLKSMTKFHGYGHSAGGLIGRMMLAKYPEIAKKCFSFTSIGTPHWGTPIADMAMEPKNDFRMSLYHAMIDALDKHELVTEMTTTYRIKNPIADAPNVKFYSMPHYMKPRKATMNARDGYRRLVEAGSEKNDCTVPFLSQIHGGILMNGKDYCEGSHIAQISSFGKYGYFPWSRIWKRNLDILFKNCLKVERGV